MRNNLKSFTKWIERKDLTYMLFIVTLIWLLSSDYGKNNQPLLDNWNFAATIVSIILAVLAIVYTFAQSASTFNSTKKLEDAVNKIEETSTVLDNINVGDLLSTLEEKIHSLEKNVDQKLQNRLDDHLEQISVFLKPVDITSSFDFGFITIEQWRDFLVKSIKEGLTPIGILLLHVHFKKQKNLDYDFELVAKATASDPLKIEFIDGMFKGQMDLLKTFNIISYEKSNIIESILPNLEIALANFVEDNDNDSLISIRHTKNFIKKL